MLGETETEPVPRTLCLSLDHGAGWVAAGRSPASAGTHRVCAGACAGVLGRRRGGCWAQAALWRSAEPWSHLVLEIRTWKRNGLPQVFASILQLPLALSLHVKHWQNLLMVYFAR